jgi:hypothetical protein
MIGEDSETISVGPQERLLDHLMPAAQGTLGIVIWRLGVLGDPREGREPGLVEVMGHSLKL